MQFQEGFCEKGRVGGLKAVPFCRRARNPIHYAPWPGKKLTRIADMDGRGHLERKSRSQHGEPTLLVD